MESKVTTPVVKGLIISLVLIVISIAIYFAGQTGNKSLGYIQYLVLLAGVIWGCVNYANQMNHNVTFGNVFAHGFKITAVVTVIVIAYTVLALKVIFPEMVDKILEQTTTELEKQNMQDSQKETALNMTRKF